VASPVRDSYEKRGARVHGRAVCMRRDKVLLDIVLIGRLITAERIRVPVRIPSMTNGASETHTTVSLYKKHPQP